MDIPETLVDLLSQIEDKMLPALDHTVWERAAYYHLLSKALLRVTRMVDCTISGLASTLGISDTKAREVLRAMHQKGSICIDSKSRTGHVVRVFVPADLELPASEAEAPPDLESLDFYNGRRYLKALLRREEGRCFYCLREVSADTLELDHVDPLANGVDHSYRNIVISCHECNKLKQDLQPIQFFRQVLRRNLLSEDEFEDRLARLNALKLGDLVPKI